MDVPQDQLEQWTGLVRREIEGQRNVSSEQIKDTAYRVVQQQLSQQSGVYVGSKQQYELVNRIYNAIKKLGILQPLIDNKEITEIMINGKDHIFIEREGRVTQLEMQFSTRQELDDIVQKIADDMDRPVNSATPIVDARLEDGSRVNIVLAPIALNGPIVTIRKFPEKVISLQDLISWQAISEEAALFLERCVKAKLNIFVSGGTGSGKTTFLNALSNFIPDDERVITIEDSAELQIQSVRNLVRLETRSANTEGKGAITIRDLIRTSLRMRPERIVVGEVRGAEALDMLQAMNTGHDGSLSTGHANSTTDMLSRLETMVLMGAEIPIEAIRKQIASAIDLVVHLGRMSDKTRKVLEITEIVDYRNGDYVTNKLFEYEREEKLVNGRIVGQLKRTELPMQQTRKFTMAGMIWGI